jgi:hypothetical protein
MPPVFRELGSERGRRAGRHWLAAILLAESVAAVGEQEEPTFTSADNVEGVGVVGPRVAIIEIVEVGRLSDARVVQSGIQLAQAGKSVGLLRTKVA